MLLYNQICQLRADTSEKERDFRNKQMSQQKAHTELVEQIQVSDPITMEYYS